MDISFKLDQSEAIAGSTLSGCLDLQVSKEIQTKGIELTFWGEETTRVEYNEDRPGEEERDRMTRDDYATRQLIKVSYPLDSSSVVVNGTIAPGSHRVKFEIALPEGLPSSLHVKGRLGNDYCKIQYKLKANFKGSGFLRNYKAEQVVTVAAKPEPRQTVPFVQQPVTEHVRLLCCIHRGSIRFGAKIADTQLFGGQPNVDISLSCINDTSVPIHRIYAKLMQYTRWHGTMINNREYVKTTLAETDFGRFDAMLPSNRQGGSSLNKRQEDEAKIYQELEQGTHTCTLQTIPTTALTTYAGKLINVSHEIILCMETGRCINNPTIRVPVKIGTPPLTGESAAAPTSTMAASSAPIQGTAVTTEDETDATTTTTTTTTPSLTSLLKEMENSTNDMDNIRTKLSKDEWKPIFSSLTPTDFGTIISKVDLEFDQVNIAELMAPSIDQFTCQHVLSALHCVADWNRSNAVEKLIPYCVDLQTNQSTIQSELSDWEQMVTKRAFEKALAKT